VRLLLPEVRELDDDALLELYGAQHPRLRAGFVLSADGAAARGGSSRGLQTPADVAVFHALRGVCDALVVGAGTARAEGYGPVRPRPAAVAWRAARGLPPRPPLVLVSRSLDLEVPSGCAGSAVVVTCAAADAGRRAALERVTDVLVAGEQEVDLATALAGLAERGLRRLLCEGGPTLLTALLAAQLVDELCLTSSPLLVGRAPTLLAAALEEPVPLRLRHLVEGDDGTLLTRYSIEPRSAVAAEPRSSVAAEPRSSIVQHLTEPPALSSSERSTGTGS
jgi:riboflavin biosynthesis pyrimidine reductase